jgi:uncharacterized protein (TIGR02265 family)
VSIADPGNLISPDDHVVFSQMMEELFVKRLGSQLGPPARAELRAVGMDIDKPLLPGYPIRVLDAALKIVVRHAFPDLPQGDAMRRMGALQVEAFVETLLGRAVFQVLRLLSLERYLDRLTRSWRSANNFIETKVTSVAPGRWEVWVNDAGQYPEVMQGILQLAIEKVGHSVRVDVLRREGLAAVYSIRDLQRRE